MQFSEYLCRFSSFDTEFPVHLDIEVDTHLMNEFERTNIAPCTAYTALPIRVSLVFGSLRYV